MNKKQNNNKGGRPSKLNDDFIKALKEVLFKEEDNIDAIIHTDKELLFLINQRLPEEKQISKRTFERWKARNKEDNLNKLTETGRKFCRLYKKALLEQKRYLFEELKGEKTGWQRWAWIIERKFDDWNIKHKTDITTQGDKVDGINIKFVDTNEDRSQGDESSSGK